MMKHFFRLVGGGARVDIEAQLCRGWELWGREKRAAVCIIGTRIACPLGLRHGSRSTRLHDSSTPRHPRGYKLLQLATAAQHHNRLPSMYSRELTMYRTCWLFLGQ